MRLEESLKLRAGTQVIANSDSLGPNALTKGKTYTLIGVLCLST